MQINNIKIKIKATREKTEVLGGRISPTKMLAFNIIAETQGVSTADLFKATIDECIESFFKDMLMVETKKARLLVDERLDKLSKKNSTNSITIRDYTRLTQAEQKIASTAHLNSFPSKIPLFWFFDDIKLDFNRETEQTNKERWIAYKNYLDEIEEKEWQELQESLDDMQDQNSQAMENIKEEQDNSKIVETYYEYIENNEEVPKELMEKFNALSPKDIKRWELLQYPFIKDSKGSQKYSNDKILQAINAEIGETITFGSSKKQEKFHSIQEIHNYMQERIRLNKIREEEFQVKLNVMGADVNDYSLEDLANIEEDPFGLTNSFMSKQIFTDDMIVRYWRHYMKDKKYFKNREISFESIKSYTLLKTDGILQQTESANG